MRRAMLIAALVSLVAFAASADIRGLMRAKGYSSIPRTGECSGSCGGFVAVQDTISDPVPINRGCTFPAAMPCVMN